MNLPPEEDPLYAEEPHEDFDDEEPEDIQEFRLLYAEDGEFLRALALDVRECEELMAKAKGLDDRAFARRTFVRTVFAEIEGRCGSAFFWARYYSSDDAHESIKSRYSRDETVVIRGVVRRLDDKGVVRVEKLKYSTEAGIVFALSLLGRQAWRFEKGGTEPIKPPLPDKSDEGWASLLKAIKIRDRLTHPRHRNDVLVTAEELSTVRLGRKWFMWTYDMRSGDGGPVLDADWRNWGDPPTSR
jgi:hypothetical protein